MQTHTNTCEPHLCLTHTYIMLYSHSVLKTNTENSTLSILHILCLHRNLWHASVIEIKSLWSTLKHWTHTRVWEESVVLKDEIWKGLFLYSLRRPLTLINHTGLFQLHCTLQSLTYTQSSQGLTAKSFRIFWYIVSIINNAYKSDYRNWVFLVIDFAFFFTLSTIRYQCKNAQLSIMKNKR